MHIFSYQLIILNCFHAGNTKLLLNSFCKHSSLPVFQSIQSITKIQMNLKLLGIITLITPLILANTVVVTPTKSYTTGSPTWLTSPYFRAGQDFVVTTLTGSSQSPFASYTFTYSSALPGVPNLAYGIQKYRGNDYLSPENYQIRQTARDASTFRVEFQIFGSTNIRLLAIAYLAVDPTFPHHLNSFDNVPINYTSGEIVNISQSVAQMKFYTNYINYTAQASGRTFKTFTTPHTSNYIVIFMTSIFVDGTYGSPVQLHIYPQVINSSFYMWNITVFQDAAVTTVHFSQIIFNSDDVESSQQYSIVYQKWENDLNGGFLSIPIEFIDNFIMGVTAFESVQGKCGFQYQWEFDNQTVSGNTTFGVSLLYSWMMTKDICGFSWSESSILYMMTWRCDPPNPYFNITTRLCQTLCGFNHYQNTTSFTCQPCLNTKCSLCDPTSPNICTECETHLFYELSNGNCVCMPEYFATASSCQLCSSSLVGCTNCSYDDGAQGTLPYDNTLFTCLGCNTTASYFLNGLICDFCPLSNCLVCQSVIACLTCDVGFGFSATQTCIVCLVTGCSICSATDGNVCSICDTTIGYYNNSTTQQCSTLCGDGIYVAVEERCDDNNTVDGNGCSSTCVVESAFYCLNTNFSLSVCGACSIYCTNCSSGTNCSACITFTDLLSNATDQFCEANCSTISSCQTCHVASAAVTCDSCLLGYLLSNNSCTLICGDGLVISPEGCDDNNTIDYDGCSSTCAVESIFTCSGSPSVCLFSASATLTLQSQAMENVVCNTITFEISLNPASDVFARPDVNWDSFLSTPNSSLLQPNSSLTNYSGGILSLSYLLLGPLQNQVIVFQADFSTLLSSSSIFSSTTASPLSFTVNTNPQAQVGYFYNTTTQQCDQICGDGIIIGFPCDDGNLVDGDGCSSICAIEAGFTCSGSPSVCPFASSVTLTLQSQTMEMVICNTITFGLSFSLASDVFARSDVNWDNFLSTPNTSLLQPNTSLTNYSGGILYFSYLMLADLHNQTIQFQADFSTLLSNSSLLSSTTSPPLSFTVSTIPDARVGYFFNATTQQCDEICGDGIIINFPCDDGNIIDGDGCSSTCAVEAGFSCSDSPSVCPFASSVILTLQSQAMACNTITFGFSFSPASAVFSRSDVNWDNFLSTPNTSLLQPNTSLIIYSSGILSLSYLLLGHLQNGSLQFQADFSTLLANSSLLSSTASPPLSFTVNTSPEALMGHFFNPNTLTCEQICGDGLRFSLPCDDGNLVSQDGCSPTCDIQPDYVCFNGSSTAPSSCIYNGSIGLALETGDKDPDNNAMTLTYKLDQSAILLTLNNGSLDYSAFVSFPGSEGVTVTSAVLNPETNQLVVTVAYSQDIQDKDLAVQVNPPNSLTVMNSSWKVDPTNQLTAVVYEEDDYEKGSRIRILANFILGCYLGMMFLTMVYRKFIGLELATLIQLGYLSLVLNREVTVYLQPVLAWQHVFGYNGHPFSALPSERFSSPYHIYAYQPHFGFSNNLMVVLTLCLYGVAGLLFLLSRLASHKRAEQLRQASFLTATSLCYTLVVFLSPNFLTSLCLELQQGVFLDWSLPWSKVFLLFSLLMLLAAHALSAYTARDSSDVGSFLHRDRRMAVYMPLVFSLRLLTLTALLFAYQVSRAVPTSLIFVVQVAYILFVVLGRPHLRPLDFFRSLCLEVGLLSIFVMRVVEISVMAEQTDPRSFWFPLVAYFEYAIYLLGITVSVASLIYHCCRSAKEKKKVSDASESHSTLKNESVEQVKEGEFKNDTLQNFPVAQLEQINENMWDEADETVPNDKIIRNLKRNRSTKVDDTSEGNQVIKNSVSEELSVFVESEDVEIVPVTDLVAQLESIDEEISIQFSAPESPPSGSKPKRRLLRRIE